MTKAEITEVSRKPVSGITRIISSPRIKRKSGDRERRWKQKVLGLQSSLNLFSNPFSLT